MYDPRAIWYKWLHVHTYTTTASFEKLAEARAVFMAGNRSQEWFFRETSIQNETSYINFRLNNPHGWYCHTFAPDDAAAGPFDPDAAVTAMLSEAASNSNGRVQVPPWVVARVASSTRASIRETTGAITPQLGTTAGAFVGFAAALIVARIVRLQHSGRLMPVLRSLRMCVHVVGIPTIAVRGIERRSTLHIIL